MKGVYDDFCKIARMSGHGSQDRKVGAIRKLLARAATGAEAKYIVRALQGNLRIGLGARSVNVCIAHALALSPPVAAVARFKTAEGGAVVKSDTSEALKVGDGDDKGADDCDDDSDDDSEGAQGGGKGKGKAKATSPSATTGKSKAVALGKDLDLARLFRAGGNGYESERWAPVRAAAEARFKQVFAECPSYDAVLPAALELGLYDGALHARCHLTPGIPARHIRH